MKSLFCTLIILLTVITSVNAQGVVYSVPEADSLYGQVLVNTEIQSILLKKFFTDTDNTLMFRIDNGQLIVLNNRREQLFPGDYQVSASDVFRAFSIELIDQIIESGTYPVTLVELRNNGVISLTNGNHTLEYGSECPPYCP